MILDIHMGAGRQRTFDKDEILDKAMKVFWQKGYGGTSLSDLTRETGLNKPSLYSAFGNKESLFVSAIKKYSEIYGARHFEKLLNGGGKLKERIRQYLESVASMVSDSSLPGGCFVANCTCESGSKELPKKALDSVYEINQSSLESLNELFKGEMEKGNISMESSPSMIADYLLMIQFGIAVMARNGVGKERLLKVINQSVSGIKI